MTNAFCTGSRIYGQFKPESDLDLVVLVDLDDLLHLQSMAQIDENVESTGYPGFKSANLRFGPLNIIATSDPEMYLAWKDGTEACKKEARTRSDDYGWPGKITRDEAVAIISSYRKARGFAEPDPYNRDTCEDLPNG